MTQDLLGQVAYARLVWKHPIYNSGDDKSLQFTNMPERRRRSS